MLSDGVKQNMEVFKDIVGRRGIPLSVYVGCGSNFKTTRYQSTEYQLKEEDQILQSGYRTKGNGVGNHKLLTFLICVDTFRVFS